MNYKDTQSILELRKETGLSQSRFAAYFDLPVRTLQEWEQGRRVPPEYLIKLLKRVIEAEGFEGLREE